MQHLLEINENKQKTAFFCHIQYCVHCVISMPYQQPFTSLDACSRALSIVLNHKEIASIMAVTGTILPKQDSNEINRNEQKKKYCPMQHLLEINEKKRRQKDFCNIQYCVHCVIFIKENRSKLSSHL